jgi:hypothetical protein
VSAAPSPVTNPSPAPPLALERVPDTPALHGPAITAPTVVGLPDGTFLMLRAQDTVTRGVLLRSDDGRIWDQVDARRSGLDAGAILDLAANPTAMVVLGRMKPIPETGEELADQAEWTSADGATWTRAPGGAALRAFGAREIVAASHGFAAFGAARLTILVSGADGWEWRPTELPLASDTRGYFERVAGAGTGFVAVGGEEGGSAAWRWDSRSWSRLPLERTAPNSDIVATDARIIVTGSIDAADGSNPGQIQLAAVAQESIDTGTTWHATGLELREIAVARVFAVEAGFLAVLYPADPRQPLSAWWSSRPGSWEPVTLGGGGGSDQPAVTTVAVNGRRVVMAGISGDTGAGGDRVVVWIGNLNVP